MADGIRLVGHVENGQMVLRPATEPATASRAKAAGEVERLAVTTKEHAEERAAERRFREVCKERGIDPDSSMGRLLRVQHMPTSATQPQATGDLAQLERTVYGPAGRPAWA